MRSRTSHAAKSGVGEHTARESESAQCMRRERVCGEHPPPNLAPGPKGSGAKLFYATSIRRTQTHLPSRLLPHPEPLGRDLGRPKGRLPFAAGHGEGSGALAALGWEGGFALGECLHTRVLGFTLVPFSTFP